MKNIVYNCDCMEFMKTVPDKYYELSVCDPPYGIGENWNKNKTDQFYGHKNNFNNLIPSKEYFNELLRISENQIIWGGNYFCHFLEMRNSWIFWDKCLDSEKIFHSEGELAWTSFDKPMRKIKKIWNGGKKGIETGIKRIHPHQKPIELYKWTLQKYAKKNDKIFDSHVGSGSLRIACYELGFDFEGCELDFDYWNDQEKRFFEFKQKYHDQFYIPAEKNNLFEGMQ